MKSDINMKVTLHTRINSFAIHSLENGTNLGYIQTLLGYRSSWTTEIYTHLSQLKLQGIKNPLDIDV